METERTTRPSSSSNTDPVILVRMYPGLRMNELQNTSLAAKATNLRELTRTFFFAHSTARLEAKCLTANRHCQSSPIGLKPGRSLPAFEALYGACGYQREKKSQIASRCVSQDKAHLRRIYNLIKRRTSASVTVLEWV